MHERKAVRYPLELPVTFRWTTTVGQHVSSAGFTRDISSVAMFIRSADCPPAEIEVHCEVMLPRFRNRGFLFVKACGQVLRVDGAESTEQGFVLVGDMLLLSRETSLSAGAHGGDIATVIA